MTSVTVVNLDAESLVECLDAVELLYRLAFAEDRSTSARFRQRLVEEARMFPGFRFLLAQDGTEPVGFIYGYHLQPDNWWPQMILPALRAAGQEDWLDDCFELVEFAVAPDRQGEGIGSQLYDALFATVEEPRALLGTDPPPTAAHRLYTKRGWITVLDNWRMTPDDPETHIVMGLDRTRQVQPTGN